jgi:hypothetical protein
VHALESRMDSGSTSNSREALRVGMVHAIENV